MYTPCRSVPQSEPKPEAHDDGLIARSPPVIASGNPEKDAGWLVNTPWLGRRMAVFGLTKEDALAQAKCSRAAYVAELQASVDRWTAYELEACFVEAESDQ